MHLSWIQTIPNGGNIKNPPPIIISQSPVESGPPPILKNLKRFFKEEGGGNGLASQVAYFTSWNARLHPKVAQNIFRWPFSGRGLILLIFFQGMYKFSPKWNQLCFFERGNLFSGRTIWYVWGWMCWNLHLSQRVNKYIYDNATELVLVKSDTDPTWMCDFLGQKIEKKDLHSQILIFTVLHLLKLMISILLAKGLAVIFPKHWIEKKGIRAVWYLSRETFLPIYIYTLIISKRAKKMKIVMFHKLKYFSEINNIIRD